MSEVTAAGLRELADEVVRAHWPCVECAYDGLSYTLRSAAEHIEALEQELTQVRQHHESLVRHCAEIEREFAPSTRWRAVLLIDRLDCLRAALETGERGDAARERLGHS